MLYVTVAGIKRSGSTWMANAIRIICEEAGLKVWLGEHRPDDYNHENTVAVQKLFKADQEDQVIVNKIHPYIHEVAQRSDLVFTSYRDLMEIVKSWNKFKGPVDVKVVQQWTYWYYLWRRHSCYEMSFEDLQHFPKSVVEFLIFKLQRSFFKIPHTKAVDPRRVMHRLEEELVPPSVRNYDPKTLLFKGHITSACNG